MLRPCARRSTASGLLLSGALLWLLVTGPSWLTDGKQVFPMIFNLPAPVVADGSAASVIATDNTEPAIDLLYSLSGFSPQDPALATIFMTLTDCLRISVGAGLTYDVTVGGSPVQVLYAAGAGAGSRFVAEPPVTNSFGVGIALNADPGKTISVIARRGEQVIAHRDDMFTRAGHVTALTLHPDFAGFRD